MPDTAVLLRVTTAVLSLGERAAAGDEDARRELEELARVLAGSGR